MPSYPDENQLLLAIRAIEKDSKLSVRAAAKIYNVRRAILQHRIRGRPARQSIRANNHKLTEAEEDAIVKYVMDLAGRAFPFRLRFVEDMANQLLQARGSTSPVTITIGLNWASNFVYRRFELCI
jgi:hypothetical protein